MFYILLLRDLSSLSGALYLFVPPFGLFLLVPVLDVPLGRFAAPRPLELPFCPRTRGFFTASLKSLISSSSFSARSVVAVACGAPCDEGLLALEPVAAMAVLS